jgi:hypothetical protein
MTVTKKTQIKVVEAEGSIAVAAVAAVEVDMAGAKTIGLEPSKTTTIKETVTFRQKS